MREVGEETVPFLIKLFVHFRFHLFEPDVVLQAFLLRKIADDESDQGNGDGTVYQVSPPGFPQRRQDNDFQCGSLFIPDSVVVGAFHDEAVSSGRNIGVVGSASVTDLVPVGVEPFQFVGIFVFAVEDIVQRTVFNGYIGLIMIEYDFLLGGDVLLQYIFFVVGAYQFVVDI